MYYIHKQPNEAGSRGNPQSLNFGDRVGLPDEMLDAYMATHGFVDITYEDGVVTALAVNQTAFDAYMDEHPVVEETPAQKRENAYNTERVIEWGGEMLTVTEAAQLWQYYAAEGNDKAAMLTSLIASAKETIRGRFADDIE